jgi:hypothetical protein
MDIVERVCTAYAWQRALGHNTMRDPFCCLVWDRVHPDVWDANHVSEVRARTAADIARVLQRRHELQRMALLSVMLSQQETAA